MAMIYAAEDDAGIGELYGYAFESAGYEYKIFETGKEFLLAAEKRQPELALLDIMLPDTDGYTILKKLREAGRDFPVIMVTAKGDEISKVKGLNLGADDYVVKPFSVLELLARINARLRTFSGEKEIKHGSIVINEDRRLVSIGGREIKLALKEYELFRLLFAHPEKVYTRDEILSAVWGVDFMGESRALDMQVKNLRDKLEEAGARDCLVTVRGVGYKFVLPENGNEND